MSEQWVLFWWLSGIYGVGGAIFGWLCYRYGKLRGATETAMPQRFKFLGRQYVLIGISGSAWDRYADPHGPITYTYQPTTQEDRQ